jgi:hypothetical protein
MKLIQTVTLASTQTSIVFSSIPQTFTDLVILSSTRTGDGATSVQDFGMNLGGTETFRRLNAGGSTVTASTNSGYVSVGVSNTNITAANTFSSNTAYILNYTSSIAKSILMDGVQQNSNASVTTRIEAGLSTNTAAVTSLSLSSAGASFQIGTIVSLYGITAGSDGITTVT